MSYVIRLCLSFAVNNIRAIASKTRDSIVYVSFKIDSLTYVSPSESATVSESIVALATCFMALSLCHGSKQRVISWMAVAMFPNRTGDERSLSQYTPRVELTIKWISRSGNEKSSFSSAFLICQPTQFDSSFIVRGISTVHSNCIQLELQTDSNSNQK